MPARSCIVVARAAHTSELEPRQRRRERTATIGGRPALEAARSIGARPRRHRRRAGPRFAAPAAAPQRGARRAAAEHAVEQFDAPARDSDRAKVQCGERPHCVPVVVESGEQLLGFFDAALAHAQVRQAAARARPHASIPSGSASRALSELVLGVVPPSGGNKDARVVRPAVARRRRSGSGAA